MCLCDALSMEYLIYNQRRFQNLISLKLDKGNLRFKVSLNGEHDLHIDDQITIYLQEITSFYHVYKYF